MFVYVLHIGKKSNLRTCLIEGCSTSGACFLICTVMSQEARGLVFFLEYVHSMVCGGKYWCGID